MPAPSLGDKPHWLARPLTPAEVTGILRAFLNSDDVALSSHSLKATTLSWASKAEMPREQRRILGRHSTAVQDSDAVYSRDLSVGPVNEYSSTCHHNGEGWVVCAGRHACQFFPELQLQGSRNSSSRCYATVHAGFRQRNAAYYTSKGLWSWTFFRWSWCG